MNNVTEKNQLNEKKMKRIHLSSFTVGSQWLTIRV